MKPLVGVSELLRSPRFVKITAFSLLFLSLVFLAKHFSDGYYPPQPDVAALLNNKPPPSPPPPPAVERIGIVDEHGAMSPDFKIGDFDPNLADDVRNFTLKEENSGAGGGGGGEDEQVRVNVTKYRNCDESMRDHIPCMDNMEAIGRLKSMERGERFERLCPEHGKGLDCVVPRPPAYRPPIRWPQSRDEVWFGNVPHPRLVEDKGGQNWIAIKGDKFVFPGGGTQFIHGANQYLDQITEMIPGIKFGQHTRVALDVGSGVASFGAFLMQRNVTTLSIAPKDVHENQIQFALERGVPAMVSAFVTHRLLYPSQAFDLIHCSRCRINWTRDDGILLLEVDRMLRAGGYFAWAAQPVYKHEKNLQEQWKEMEDLASSICWQLVKKQGYIAIWQKPLNNSCYLNRASGVQPPLCDPKDDPDNVWYVTLKPCITRLPDNGYGANISAWPERLHYPPDRLQSIEMDAYISRKDLFTAESKYGRDIVESYVNAHHWKELNLRNVMDMRAGFGGFAAAMNDAQLDCWVMNVVPVSGFNTLPVIYDRGLIGVMHDWCEPFDTYPRTYDLLHAAGLFSIEKKRCDVSTIMLEMDRILRPDGHVYIRDSITIVPRLHEIATAIGWVCALQDAGQGLHSSWKILRCDKRF